MTKGFDQFGNGSQEVVPDAVEVREGDKVRVFCLLDDQLDQTRDFPAPELREVLLVGTEPLRFVVFCPVGDDVESATLSRHNFPSVDAVRAHGPIPEYFAMPVTVLTELMENYGWTVVGRPEVAVSPSLVDRLRSVHASGVQTVFRAINELLGLLPRK